MSAINVFARGSSKETTSTIAQASKGEEESSSLFCFVIYTLLHLVICIHVDRHVFICRSLTILRVLLDNRKCLELNLKII